MCRDLMFFLGRRWRLRDCAPAANGGTIYPANSSFEDNDASAGGPLGPGILEGTVPE